MYNKNNLCVLVTNQPFILSFTCPSCLLILTILVSPVQPKLVVIVNDDELALLGIEYVFQHPGTLVSCPPGNGAAHFVYSNGIH